MGRRGPRPEPTATLRLKGSWRANSRPEEPVPPAGPIRCPGWIPEEAKTAWRVLAPMLEEMGVFTRADRNALTRYCVLWARWRTAEEAIEEKGSTSGGRLIPEVRLAGELAAALLRLEQEFGLTPSARTRIHAEQQKVEDPLGAFAIVKDDDRPPEASSG